MFKQIQIEKLLLQIEKWFISKISHLLINNMKMN